MNAKKKLGLLVAAVTIAGVAAGMGVASAQTGYDRTKRDHAETQKVLNQAVGPGGHQGIVAEVRDQNGTWFGSAGLSDVINGRKRSQDEQFRIGSMTKAFTATLVLQLAAEGKLSLDDTVEKWLPGVVQGNGNDGNKITIKQLLNQTGRIPNYVYDDPEMLSNETSEKYLNFRFARWRPEQLIAIAMTHPPHTTSTFWYSNANYQLAGMIIEKASGSTFSEQLNRRIVRPLRLTGTYLPSQGEYTIRGKHPRLYSILWNTKPDAPLHDVTEVDASLGWAAGGMVSTTWDLSRFLDAVLRGKLLPPAQHKAMWDTVGTENSEWLPKATYGTGVWKQPLDCGVTVQGFGGFINGSLSYAMGTADGKHTVVINLNGDRNQPFNTVNAVLAKEFCPKR
jgi:D-alanyl-D-alanine carboxypeptidase